MIGIFRITLGLVGDSPARRPTVNHVRPEIPFFPYQSFSGRG